MGTLPDPESASADDSARPGNRGGDLVELVAELLELEPAERERRLTQLDERDARFARARLAALGELGLALDESATLHGVLRRLGHFVRLERVGVGGMGEVYLARDERNGELAALKILRPEHLWFEVAHRRFRREVEAMIPLAHPGIVRVLDVGEEEGVPWLALEWVGGVSLENVVDRLRAMPPDTLGPRTFEEAVRALCAGRAHSESPLPGAFPGRTYAEVVTRVVVRVARALAHAHAAGVMHRDVKPGNVLVTPAGRVLLADFSLALPRDVDRMTREGTWLGSLPYAAPEQIEGGSRPVDARIDVYSLGALLYELVTLRTPFLGGTEQEVRRRIATADIEAPRTLNRNLPIPIEVVCLSAMDPRADRRPASVEAMAEDLERALSGQPIRARTASWALRARRWIQRHPVRTVSLLASALVVSFVALAAAREIAVGKRLERLADDELVRGLMEDARDFWPASPTHLVQMEAWLRRAEGVIGRRVEHESELAALRAVAEPYRDADRQRDQATALERLGTLAREVDGLQALLMRLSPNEPPRPLDPAVVRARDGEIQALLRRPPREIVAALRAKIAGLGELAEAGPHRWERDLEQVRAFDAIAEDCARRLEEQTTVRFAEPLDAWRFGALRRLLTDWDGLIALVERVRRQRAETERLARHAETEGAAEWERARAAIAGAPCYRGLRPVPAFGLVPLEADPRSGLWEFLLATTGDAPVRDASTPSGWRVDAADGIVLVLLPGGRTSMGAPPGSDLELMDARPAHVVELDPFLMSKFELTRAQAARMALVLEPAPLLEDGRRPVVLDWHRARALLAAVGLDLPTEAQWEYAARGGSHGPVWPLQGCANVLDRTLADAWRRQGYRVKEESDEFDDSWADTAPVGSLAPNGYGLHDMLGNVAEWCLDPFIWRGYASLIPRAGDGLRDTVAVEGLKAVRGGSCIDGPIAASPWMRSSLAPATLNTSTGVRPVMRIRME